MFWLGMPCITRLLQLLRGTNGHIERAALTGIAVVHPATWCLRKCVHRYHASGSLVNLVYLKHGQGGPPLLTSYPKPVFIFASSSPRTPIPLIIYLCWSNDWGTELQIVSAKVVMSGGIPKAAAGASAGVLLYSIVCLILSTLLVCLLWSYGERWTCKFQIKFY